jgi:multiple antibiotic resistance protein
MLDAAEFIEVAVPLFIIINPLVVLPNFAEMSQQLDNRHCSLLSLRTSVSAFLLLAFFIFIGRPFLDLIGVSTEAFMIACGLLLLSIAIGMLSGSPPTTRNVEFDTTSIVPMSIPLLAGPGSVATAIVLTEAHGAGIVFAALVLSMVLSAFIFDRYRTIMHYMTRNGINAWTRLSSLFFAAIAVRLISEGILLMR